MQINTSHYSSLYFNPYRNVDSKDSAESVNLANNLTHQDSKLNHSFINLNSANPTQAQESSTQNKNLNNEAIQQKIDDLLASPTYPPYYIDFQEAIFYDRVAVSGDSNTQFEKFMELQQHLLDNVPLPTEQTFEKSKEALAQEISNVLNHTYKAKGEDSKEFQALLSFAKTFFEMDESRVESKQKLLNLLQQGQNSLDYATSEEFFHKLFTKTEGLSTMTLKEINAINEKQGFMVDYTSDNLQVIHSLEEFFGLADFYGLIPQESKDKISENLQISQRYLYNQSGKLENHFQLEGFTISWEGDTLFNSYLSGSKISIAPESLSSNLLGSLASHFDSTQSIFDILNQKEKLEKENQELKQKQGMETYGINTNNPYRISKDSLESQESNKLDSAISSGDSVFQAIFKDLGSGDKQIN